MDMKRATWVKAEIKETKEQIKRDGADSWTRGYLAALKWVIEK